LTVKNKKSRGQNFIFDKNFLKKISNFIKTNSDNILIEIGPGPGTLTEFLYKKSFKKLILIEKDSRLLTNLNNTFSLSNIDILNQDALNFDFQMTNLKNSIIVGNLPFNISVDLLYLWTKLKKWPPNQVKMVLMFQKEVANRIMAEQNNKSYGKLSIVIQSRYRINKLLDVPSSLFTPPPKVDGTILEFTPHNDYRLIDINKIDEVSRAAFSQRRKKIKNNMFKYIQILNMLSIDTNLRPENLSVKDYCEIAKNI
jgi:16S rRNA (adenine1518-N6/adenine1519-N6)-dimethyltransferase